MTDPVIELVQELAANPKAGPELVARSVGSRLARIEGESNSFFDIYRSAAPVRTGAVSSLEMRVRRADSTVKIYVLTVDTKKHCLQEKDIAGVFGAKFEFVPPAARSAAVVPTYHSYKFSTHEISFGLDRSGQKCCSRVVVEFSG